MNSPTLSGLAGARSQIEALTGGEIDFAEWLLQGAVPGWGSGLATLPFDGDSMTDPQKLG